MKKLLSDFMKKFSILLIYVILLSLFSLFASAEDCAGTEIYDWYDLYDIRNNLSGTFCLMNDLDNTTQGYGEIASKNANGGLGYDPPGNFEGVEFTGKFYGQGYTISDMNINRPSEDLLGLFGRMGSGLIQNVGIVDANITGNNYVGSLVGGFDDGTVKRCYSSGVVVANDNTGGLIGELDQSSVFNSYSLAKVNGNQYVGGMAGACLFGCTIENSYSTGRVSGSEYAQCFAGNDDGSFNNNYCNEETSNNGFGGGAGLRTTSNMTWEYSNNTYQSWNISQNGEAIWRSGNHKIVQDHVGNYGYPALSWQNTPKVKLNYPENNSKQRPLNVSLGVNITSDLNESMNATFINEVNETILGEFHNFSNNSELVINWGNLSWGKKYYWKVKVEQNEKEYESNVYTFTTNYAPNVTFESKIPSDISYDYLYENDTVNITYRITDQDGNLNSTYMFNNVTNHGELVKDYINGTGYEKNFTLTGYVSNTNDTYTFTLEHYQILPFNTIVDPDTMTTTEHSFRTLNNSNDILMANIQNISNKTTGYSIEFMANTSENNTELDVYYCNESYTSGKINESAYCTLFKTIEDTKEYDYCKSNYSCYHKAIVPDNGSVNNVSITPNSYFAFQPTTNDTWNIYGINSSLYGDKVKVSNDNGDNYTVINFVPDILVNQINGSEYLNYYACAEDDLGASYCSDQRQDMLELGGVPPSEPTILVPDSTEIGRNVTIEYKEAVSPNDYDITEYLIELYNYSDDSLVETIEFNNAPYTTYEWDTVDLSESEIYYIKVTAKDSNNLTSYDNSLAFAVDNTLPYVTGFVYETGTDWVEFEVNVSEDSIINYRIGDSCGDSDFAGSSLDYVTTFSDYVWGLNSNTSYSIQFVIEDTVGNVNTECYNFTTKGVETTEGYVPTYTAGDLAPALISTVGATAVTMNMFSPLFAVMIVVVIGIAVIGYVYYRKKY